MSAFNKYLWPILVPTGGWDFDTNITVPVTITAGVKASILELCAELEALLDALGANNWEVIVSQVGIVSITCDNGAGVPVLWTLNRAATDDDLEACFGSDGTEVVVNGEIEFAYQHLHGYYPGCVSWGHSAHQGTGTASTRYWQPDWAQVRTVAGSHETRSVGPVTARQTMALQYGLIKDVEANDADIGLRAFIDECATAQFRLYPDRAIGTVDDPGTQDTKTVSTQPEDDYWLCAFVEGGDPVYRQGQAAGFGTFGMTLNREPAP